MEIWVLGNGESRKKFNLSKINSYSIGCNAIHRDFNANIFVAVDRKMVKEILNNPNQRTKTIYTRPDWYKEFGSNRVISLPSLWYEGTDKQDQGFHWNSGPYAILVACYRNPKTVHLVGFDLYGVKGLQNNIYKDTENYAPGSHKEVRPDFWIHQLKQLFEHFDKINFIQHQLKDWQIPLEWRHLENLTVKYFPV